MGSMPPSSAHEPDRSTQKTGGAPPRSASSRLSTSCGTSQHIVNWCSDECGSERTCSRPLGTDRSLTTGPVLDPQRSCPPRTAILNPLTPPGNI